MARPRIFTAEFWTRRIDALTDNVPRMWRTGTQAVLLNLGLSTATPVNAFELDWKLLAGSFAGGCVIWALTTSVAPPKD